MGDKRRFDEFAKFIQIHFPNKSLRIADVAGGKAALQQALRQLRYQNVITFDKRKGKKDRPKMRYQYRYFNEVVTESFDLLVGMHPDGATDVIIKEAHRRKIPFAIVPCCIIPNAWAFWKQYKFNSWVDHLEEKAQSLGFETKRFYLHINGRNLVLTGKL